MADRRISDLNPAPSTLNDTNTLFAVEQARTAYRVDGHAFIEAIVGIYEGHGGIADIEYTEPSSGSLEGTLTITLADQTTEEFTITNGKEISSITQYFAVNNSSSSVPTSWSTSRQTMTNSNRYLWSYFRFAFNDSTTADTPKSIIGVYGDTGEAWYVWIRYAGQQPTSDADIGTTPDDWIGIYSGTSSTAPTHYTDYEWFQYKGETGNTGADSEVTDQSVQYAQGDYANIAPSGGWSDTIPTVAQGKFLWTKTELVFNDDTQNPLVFYSVARMGIDGTGSVSSVNGISPDGTGNITVTASDIQASDNQSIQTNLNNLVTAVGNVVHVGTSAPSDSSVKLWLDTDEPGMTAVSSVNDKTGTVVLDAEDVGAMSKWVKLWENASPGSSFAAQTVTLDLSGYDFLMVASNYTTTSGTRYAYIVDNVSGHSAVSTLQSGISSTTAYWCTRTFTIRANGIEFGESYRRSWTATSAPNASNDYVVPQYIYGIKGAINS